MKLDILKSLNAERNARRAAVVVTDQASGEQRLVKAADVAKDPLKDLIEKHIRSGKSGMEETPQGKFFLTVHVPAPRIVVTGAVHISQALAPIAKLLGYDVTIVDPRTAFASQERFPDVKVIAEWPDVALPPLGVDRYTAFVALTHDPKIDDPALTHALQRDCFYIGALGSRKTHGRRLDRLERAGVFRRRSRAHPRADRAADRRGVAGRDRGRDHGRDHRPPAPGAAEGRGENPGDGIVKFGAVPIAEAEGGVAVHSIRKGSLVLKKGTVIGRTEIAALQAAGIPDIVVARLEPGDVSEDAAAGDIATAVAGEGVRVDRAFTGRANLFSGRARRAGRQQDGDRRAQPDRRGGHLRDLAGVQAGGRRRDDRDREDHPVCGCRRAARRRGIGGARRRAAGQGRALSHPQGRRDLDHAARPRRQGHREDHAGDRRAARARRRDDRRRAPRPARQGRAGEGAGGGAARGRRARDRVRRLGHRRPPRRDPGRGRGDRRPGRAFRHAGRSRQSAAARRCARPSAARRAGLRALAEGERIRLGSDALAGGP